MMLADGLVDPQAAAEATDFCTSKAIVDAEVAARNAAQVASLWNEIGRYGAGADPKIDGAGAASFGIDFGVRYFGGWKVNRLEVTNCVGTGVHVEAFEGWRRGLWITQCSLHDNNNPTGALVPGYGFNTGGRTIATGWLATGVVQVFVDNCTENNNDSPHLIAGNDQVLDTLSAVDSQYLQSYHEFGSRIVSIGCTWDHMCNGPGIASGSAGVLCSVTTDCIFVNCTIRRTVLHGADGVGIDFEGQNVRPRLFGCTIGDATPANSNAGSAILDFNNGGVNSGLKVDSCIFDNNGIGFPVNSNPTLARSPTGGTTDDAIFTNCQVHKPVNPPAPVTQPFLFAEGHNTVPTDVIAVHWPNGLFGADNIVT